MILHWIIKLIDADLAQELEVFFGSSSFSWKAYCNFSNYYLKIDKWIQRVP
jgi:hypothetical protein